MNASAATGRSAIAAPELRSCPLRLAAPAVAPAADSKVYATRDGVVDRPGRNARFPDLVEDAAGDRHVHLLHW
jgi:hypothetical protein